MVSRRDNPNCSLFKTVMDMKTAIRTHTFNHLITRSKEWSMVKPLRKISQMITKTQITIPPIKVKKIKVKKSTRLMTPQKMKMKYRL